MGTKFTTEVSRCTVTEGNFGTLEGGVLLDFCFLEPRQVGRSPRSIELDILFPFLVWTLGFWPTKGVASSKTYTPSSSSIPLATPFSLFSFMVANPMLKMTKLVILKKKKKKKREEMDDTYFDEWSPLE